jgi:tetratricopeptide (TPR) repeat protein
MNCRRLLVCVLSMINVLGAFGQQTAKYFDRSGLAKERSGDYQGAIADYNRAIELNPKYAVAYDDRASAKGLAGDNDGALADCNKAIELNPRYALAYANRGGAKGEKGDLDGATADCNRALELDPNCMLAYDNRGTIKSREGDLDGAKADYDHAIELSPKFAVTYNNRGTVEESKGEYHDAVVDFNEAIQLDPKFAIAYVNRAGAKMHRGHYEDAIADCNRAIELDPKKEAAYLRRGWIRTLKGDFDAAALDYNQAIVLPSKLSSQSFNNRGLIKELQKDFRGALDDLSRSDRLATNRNQHDYAHLRIWVLQTRQGQTAKADKELSDYLRGRSDGSSQDFPSEVGEFLLGRVSESELMASAVSANSKQDQEQRCRAWYYAGIKRWFSGEQKIAAEYFGKCIATNGIEFDEYLLAKFESPAL